MILFSNMLNSMRLGRAATCLGMVPLSLLTCIRILWSLESAPRACGIVPEKFVSAMMIEIICLLESHCICTHSHAD